MKMALDDLRKKSVIAVCALTSSMALASCASAEFTPNCSEMSNQPEANSVEELIEQAEYIDLYTVTSASEAGFVGKSDSPFQVAVFDFEMSLSSSVSGNAPRKITLRGAKPGQSIPESYFFLKDRHQEIVERDSPLLGLSYKVETTDGTCEIIPELLVGYSYLVFSGANSSAAYEPILSTRYDPFYQAVVQRVKNRE